ncbi:phospholipid/cholesterol/gamma-HCH transport system permease protein [Parabacteroides sp. PF5-5]|uniref:MlaE family ABC transporter permease n=1 Tax=unclassified Parabacteroides TaxID=2649774 RepID=UPI002473DB1C|nr:MULTISPECIES: ABC transporter permease [unclassified Parabacteroides]MDH6306621.1 phospholipid/cholesterol/gamma-HCH transport system permease protein [Parabacteroides sp. PH5-39]MDH6317588.1 phospholipid/cholesterol/gamma-HCH transport system permease protein [Parabacteroides sp. PF5-13]MDH6321332.1 phospholipid/cholesterol/gamma-HCH transport system permease protein [Parabacteroides sp. PH5-13]MDH6325103.1 phospholipid/cholesterol/gamma-HCH transport system permease protein [Parabacteroide
MNESLHRLGEYTLLMKKAISIPDRWGMFFRQLIKEIYKLGFDSLWIVIIISVFIGTVIAIQISLNITSPMIPTFTIGYMTREIILLEFSSSIMCLILAGKVGSNIASEIGTMRVTEQIDAMEIMGVNSSNFLILPKLVGLMSFIPVLVVFSMFTGIMGGVFASHLGDGGVMSPTAFEYGLQVWFNPFYVWYSIIKSVVYAFIIASISSYFGYYVKGGALEVGKASTNAVVMSSIMILLADVIMTHLMLT